MLILLINVFMDNQPLYLAEQFVLHTQKNLFLTGRAGTGKTTFLQNVLKKTKKKYVIVAPTGVAAINAGGVTIHSMFQFPLTAFTPDSNFVDLNLATNRRGLAKHLRFRREKAKLLRELDLLVIDEISMVRADLLDAIDFALRKVRGISQPFGNVQLLVIGDLFQLAPVVKPPIWNILQKYYKSPFFFDAQSWYRSQPLTIELTKIYRQTNLEFINILNRMRYGHSTPEDVYRLNQNYRTNEVFGGHKFITLTTHNVKADRINQEQMAALEGKEYLYKAEITDLFNNSAYPVEETLRLKVGAQVMFIRNDPDGRYFNGKLAEVVKTSKKSIEVELEDGDILEVDQVTWDNKKYEINQETNEIEAQVLGSFSQYPLRLAWAITVHKSQGLTFDRMVVDLGDTFSPGQAYVALSRCTSLDGLVLRSKMDLKNIMVSKKIIEYHDRAPGKDQLGEILKEAKLKYAGASLKKLFSLEKIGVQMEDWRAYLREKKVPEQKAALQLAKELQEKVKVLEDISKKFQRQLEYLIFTYTHNQALDPIKERVQKAVVYFTHQIFTQIIDPLEKHIKAIAYKSKVKKYLILIEEIRDTIWANMHDLYQPSFMGVNLYDGEINYKPEKTKKLIRKVKKAKKGSSILVTLELYNEGKSISEISKIRSLAISTVESHTVTLIKKGDLPIEKVLSREEIEQVSYQILKDPDAPITHIKNKVAPEITFNKIRMVKAYLEIIEQKMSEASEQ